MLSTLGKIILNFMTDILLITDAQETFMEEGGLAVPGGRSIVPKVHGLMAKFPLNRRFASKDRHPHGHISFAGSYIGFQPYFLLTLAIALEMGPNIVASHALFTYDELIAYLTVVGEQRLWPEHGEAGTKEAELYPSLAESDFMFVQVKGMNPRVDSYSPFFDNVGNSTGLDQVILDCMKLPPGIKPRVFNGGLAFRHCVGFGSLNIAEKLGWESYIIEDATRTVPGMPEYDREMDKRFEKAGVKIIQSDDLELPKAA